METRTFMDKIFSQWELISDSLYQKTKLYLPFVARVCLLSHFLQENYMVYHHYNFHCKTHSIGTPETTTKIILAVSFITRTVGFFMALFKKKVPLACGLLFGSGVLQILVTYSTMDISSLLVNVSVFGSLFFLLTDSEKETSSSLAGTLSLDDYKSQDYMKLVGRCLLVIMFVNLISLEITFQLILQDIIGFALMILVIIGHRTNFTVLVTILYLNIFNFYDNDWFLQFDGHEKMISQHKFLKGISVTGGLLMLILQGPGKISLDKKEKKWN